MKVCTFTPEQKEAQRIDLLERADRSDMLELANTRLYSLLDAACALLHMHGECKAAEALQLAADA